MASNQSDQQKTSVDELGKALSTIINIVLGDELTTIRESITSLGAELNRKLDNLKQGNNNGLEKIRMEMDSNNRSMASRIDELSRLVSKDRDENTKSLINAETRLITSIFNLKEQVEKDHLRLKNQLDIVNLSHESSLNFESDRTTKKIATLDRVISDQEKKLKQHEFETARVTGLLSNLANIFGQGLDPSTQTKTDSQNRVSKGKKNEAEVDPAIVSWLGKRTSKIKTL